MKKLTLVLMFAMMGVMLTACGQKTNETPALESDVSVDQSTEDAETDVAEVETPAETETETGEAPAETEATDAGETYTDNFAVDSEAAAAFAKQIKAAVAEQDIEALADIMFFPTYVGFADGGVSVTSRDEFIELGADRVFTTEMMDSIAGADTANLSPSIAGFSVTKDGKPNIIFGVPEGELKVVGMNY